MREMEARVKEDTRSVVEDQVNNAAMVAGNAAVEGGGAPNPIAGETRRAIRARTGCALRRIKEPRTARRLLRPQCPQAAMSLT